MRVALAFTVQCRTISMMLLGLLMADAAAAQGIRYVSTSGDDTENACLLEGSPCRSIQKGLASAQAGDTLLVGSGTFYESGLVLEKDVTVIGAGASETIVDGDGRSGSRASDMAQLRQLYRQVRQSHELAADKQGTSNARSETLRSALTTHFVEWQHATSSSQSAFVFHVENGISVRFQDLMVRDGGGFVAPSTEGGIVNDGALTIQDVRIENNIAYHDDAEAPYEYGKGGGILSSGTLIIHTSTIRGNLAVGAQFSGGRGGGIYSQGGLLITNSTIAENEAWDVQDACSGGGLVNLGTAEIIASEIVGNSSSCFEGGMGGGVYNNGSIRIEQSVVGGNRALSGWDDSAGYGGGIANFADLDLVTSTVSRNQSGSGGGIYSNGSARILSSTIVNNEAPDRTYSEGEGGGLHVVGSGISLWNTIIVGNRAGDNPFASTADCALDQDVAAGFLLTGDRTGCPASDLIVDPSNALEDVFRKIDDSDDQPYTYVPRRGGPAIDSGQCEGSGGLNLTEDQRGESRPFDDPSVPNVSDGCDIGSIELQEGADDVSSGTGVAAERGEMYREVELRQNYPNPFDASTRIEFTLPQGAYTTLAIYDLSGREVAQLIDGTLGRGRHEVAWNALGLSSGVYIYRLTAGSVNEVRRMILMKGSV